MTTSANTTTVPSYTGYTCSLCKAWVPADQLTHLCANTAVQSLWYNYQPAPPNKDAEILEELRAIRHLLEFALHKKANEV